MTKVFSALDEREILGLAISMEEEDASIYEAYAAKLRAEYPATAAVLERMRDEEQGHARMLRELHRAHYGEGVAYLRRGDVRGFLRRRPIWLSAFLSLERVRKEVAAMESEAEHFYEAAAKRAHSSGARDLLSRLAAIEKDHENLAENLTAELERNGSRAREDEAVRRTFVLQIVQPGLAGLMDGSVSTLAPVFAAAFATGQSRDAFLVGLAASVGAGISMGFAEALSDDGVLSGRGRPYIRGAVCGLMTAAGGIGHTIPFLIEDFRLALIVAVAVVAVELAVIAWIRHRYMDTPLLSATFQVVVGGVLVFLTGILIGHF